MRLKRKQIRRAIIEKVIFMLFIIAITIIIMYCRIKTVHLPNQAGSKNDTI